MPLNPRKQESDPVLEAVADSPSLADEILDEVLPEEIDWRQLVWSYPKSTLALAALTGYLVGRSRGRKMVAAAAQVAGDTVDEAVNDLIGRKLL